VLFGSYAPSLITFRGSLIEELLRRGHEVITIAPSISEELAAHLRSLGAEPVSVVLGRTSLNPVEAWRAGRRLRDILRAVRPDVLIAYTIKPIVLGVPAARAAGVPRVVTLVTGLGYAFTGGREFVRRVSRVSASLLYRRAFNQADMVIFQNEDDRADFARMRVLPGRARTGLINGSGVDVEHFTPSPPPPGASFMMMGRLVGDKGLREFAEASRRLKLLHPEVRISLLGQIDTEPHAITLAELEEFKSWGIEYHGQQGDVRPFIASHSVYVLPSYREGTPRSVLEAMAIGRAIITTDAPGCRQTVEPGETGLLVPPRDADALLKAMLHLVENPQLIAPMGAAGRRLAEERFDVHKVNARLLELAEL
jgi:glycosyltransferase involved in cell wall biosynthesis